MTTHEKRIFIKHLPEAATVPEIEAAFSDYGKIIAVDVKERKDCNAKNQSRCFAYINMEIDDRSLQKCFKHFTNNLWHGQYVELQVAKESFLERLKREREENKGNVRDTSVTPKNNLQVNGIKKNNTQKEVIVTKIFERNVTTDDSDVISSNKHNTSKINPVKNESKSKKTTIKEQKKEKNSDVTESETKRIQSLNQMIKEYQQQKSVIKAALNSVDSKPNNKIIFDEHFEVTDANCDNNTVQNSEGKNKGKSLFESDEDLEDDFDFEVKTQFEGKEGQKLLELQSRYKNDKRFLLDERFIEAEMVGDSESKDTNSEKVSLEEEKKKEIEILEEILGGKVKQKRSNSEKDSSNRKKMLRFDPTQPDHLKYEITAENPTVTKKKVKNSQKEVRSEIEQPKVSKEVFYKVTGDLKETLEEKQQFSLLNLFGKAEEQQQEDTEEQEAREISKENKINMDVNPFKYDSSDDEEDVKQDSTEPSEKHIKENQTNSTKLWSEPFFFRADDFRLQEGLDFMNRIASERKPEFAKLRRDLKEIVKAKVRNNQRKNKPFKKKLGGNKRKKMIRIKKALKR